MSKTGKPLKILVTPELYDWPEVEKLREQGHEVVKFGFDGVDLVLGPQAHRMSQIERKWLPNAITEARRRRYPKAPKEADE